MIRIKASRFCWLCLATLAACLAGVWGQRSLGQQPTHSGGPLKPEQAVYDALYYRLDLAVDPGRKSIQGALTIKARILFPTLYLVLDLDSRLSASKAHWLTGSDQSSPLHLERRAGQIWIRFPTTRQPGQEVRVRIEYGGKPIEAPRHPWVGGFVWSQTADGQPWIGVACQLDGADLWWPVKDHPSDEPDSMDLHITVPQPLIVASNGTLQGVTPSPDGSRTYHWHVANPINVYNVSLNIAPYRTITGTYQSIAGQSVPLTYWVLPENYQKGLQLFPQFSQHLRFLEEKLGPYPFRNEKYGVAETPYLGMEHQTIIAYGNGYRNNAYGFDWLHFHELCHEWWGNLVTATDWNDYWIHEGFASYMEALYAESLQGEQALHDYLAPIRSRIRNLQAVAPRESQTTVQKYFVPPEFTESDGDVNFKGAWIVHSLRHLIGDEAFFETLRRITYTDPQLERVVDGSQCQFKTTDDVQAIAERISRRDLGWFFEVYLRRPSLPRLLSSQSAGQLHLQWVIPGYQGPFPMPVPVGIGDRIVRVEMPSRSASIAIPPGLSVEVDPLNWILKD